MWHSEDNDVSCSGSGFVRTEKHSLITHLAEVLFDYLWLLGLSERRLFLHSWTDWKKSNWRWKRIYHCGWWRCISIVKWIADDDNDVIELSLSVKVGESCLAPPHHQINQKKSNKTKRRSWWKNNSLQRSLTVIFIRCEILPDNKGAIFSLIKRANSWKQSRN